MNSKNLEGDIYGIRAGLSKTIQRQLTKDDVLSIGFGNDMFRELIPTPTLTAIMIEGAIRVIDPLLPEGYATIGTSSAITYMNASFMGGTVTVIATLMEIEGRKLVFESMAFDELGQIARGRHERRIVNADRFMQSAHKRWKQLNTIIK